MDERCQLMVQDDRRNLLYSMLVRESQLRLWEENQRWMAQAEDLGFRDWMEIVELLQIQVCEEFEFSSSNLKLGLKFLRSVWTLYPHDTTLHSVAHWIKYNRAKSCILEIGKSPPNVIVYPLDEKLDPTYLFKSSAQRKQLIVASSCT